MYAHGDLDYSRRALKAPRNTDWEPLQLKILFFRAPLQALSSNGLIQLQILLSKHVPLTLSLSLASNPFCKCADITFLFQFSSLLNCLSRSVTFDFSFLTFVSAVPPLRLFCLLCTQYVGFSHFSSINFVLVSWDLTF